MSDVADLFVQGGGGGAFISSDERKDLEKSGVAFDITGVDFEKGGKYGDRYILTVVLDGEERQLGAPFQSGMDSRDETIQNVEKYLADGGAPVKARVETAGNGWVLSPA
jgi:hypothetical protein